MPLRPFPFPLNIGTDIAHLPRIRRLLLKSADDEKDPLAPFLRRLLTSRELKDFRTRFPRGQVPGKDNSSLDSVTQYLAGRWAAKEAVIKAYRHRKLRLMEIEILRDSAIGGHGGVFALVLDQHAAPTEAKPEPDRGSVSAIGRQRRALLEKPALDDDDYSTAPISDSEQPAHGYGELHGTVAKVSISHDGEYATAVCLAPEQPMEDDVGGEAAARSP